MDGDMGNSGHKRSPRDGDLDKPAKRFQSGEHTTAQIRLPSAFVPQVVGRGGAVVRRLCQESGADIQTGKRDSSGPERDISVSGTREQVITAQTLVLGMLRETQEANGEPVGTEEFEIPSSSIKLIIGSRGAQIKQLQQLSGANIQVPHNPDTEFVQCALKGVSASRDLARLLVSYCITGGRLPSIPSSRPDSTSGSMKMSAGAQSLGSFSGLSLPKVNTQPGTFPSLDALVDPNPSMYGQLQELGNQDLSQRFQSEMQALNQKQQQQREQLLHQLNLKFTQERELLLQQQELLLQQNLSTVGRQVEQLTQNPLLSLSGSSGWDMPSIPPLSSMESQILQNSGGSFAETFNKASRAGGGLPTDLVGPGVLSLIIPDGAEKRIIGKGGITIKELITTSKADIQVPRALQRSDGSRVVQIKGDLIARVTAANLIAERIEEFAPQDARKGRTLFRFVVSRETGPKLVGKKGANIREVQSLTEADVQVRADDQDARQTVVNVSGSLLNCRNALQLLLELAEKEKA